MVSEEALVYLPVLIILVIASILAFTLLGISTLFGGKWYNRAKYSVYECGVPEVGNARQKFSVRYYLIAIIFLLFDVEVVFLYPWAVVYRKFLPQGAFILIEMAVFVGILTVGYLYLLRRGALEWD